jgi:hypothetical protein
MMEIDPRKMRREKSTLKAENNTMISPTHKRTEGRAPVWGSKFTTGAAPKKEFAKIFF